MKLSNISKRTASVTLTLEDETLNLTVRPYLLTTETERSIEKAEDQATALLDFIVEYIAVWDLEGEDGQPVPLDRAVIEATVPSAILLWMLTEARRQTDPLAKTLASRPRR